ncbi:MAG TPA: hypothetical protein VG899_03125 [Mycobacteriales bacterium]|nr:hypothetical protein [Mycobacteriales bacterium]
MPVWVAIASKDTRRFTQLACVSAMRTAGQPIHLVVGDCASTDGSLEWLRAQHAAGWLQLVEGPADRRHGQWIDTFRQMCPERHLIVLDSDLRCRRHGWVDMVLRHLDDAALVAFDRSELTTYTELRPTPLQGITMKLLPRPMPFVLGLDQERLRDVDTSFVWQPAYQLADPSDFAARPEAYDTAGAFAAEIERRGMRWETLSERERTWFIHYGGQSWDTKLRLARSSAVSLQLWQNRLRLRDKPAPV